ncbi:MAG: HK97 family phage prohead protease [Bacteroidota bacterium]
MGTFVLSDERVNKYGFRVLTAGIDLAEYKRNPILLLMHNRRLLPIGKIENLKVKDGKLLGDPVFDTEDELAQKVKSKVDQDILNAVSIGFRVMATSDDPKHLLPGQTRATVTKAALYEVSIVDIPANSGAMKLSFPEHGVTLSGNVDQHLADFIPNISTNSDMKKIAVLLGLPEDASEQQICDAVGKLNALASQAVPTLLSLGKANGTITEENETHFKALAQANFESTLSLIETTKPQNNQKSDDTDDDISIRQLLQELQKGNGGQGQGTERDKWTLTEWRQKDPEGLGLLQANDPEKFNALVAALPKV